jgi:menaquinone-specific isochorismate synthase
MAIRPASESPLRLHARDEERLHRHLSSAVARARRGGRSVLASITAPLPANADPCAIVCASRRAGEDWFVLEHREHGGAAVAALGAAARLEAGGPGRFAELAARWRTLAAEAVGDDVVVPAAAGPLALGGFSFADEGGRSPTWDGFAPASLVVPEVSIARGERGGERLVALTLTACAAPDDVPEQLLRRLLARVAELREAPLPLLDPAPTGRFQVSSVMPPEHYEQAVARGVAAIRDGALEKIVLAREVLVRAPQPHDAAAVFGVLREAFPACFVFCVGHGDATLVAASPELLIRREGLRASTLALAGSTRRSADPAVDDHLGEGLLRSHKDRAEQAIVTRRIERTLRPHALWVTAAPEPALVRVANIQHLATPIRAQLARPIDVIELVGLMHPTPAVGGEPLDVAAPLIPALEGLDRGWYAGPVGWSDRNGDGEFCVALRCALLRGRDAHCYAGVGVVSESDPASELAETEIKLSALLPVLAG